MSEAQDAEIWHIYKRNKCYFHIWLEISVHPIFGIDVGLAKLINYAKKSIFHNLAM